jgi:hypothetical protein
MKALPCELLSDFQHIPLWLWQCPEAISQTLAWVVVALCAVFAVVANRRASPGLTAVWGAIHGAAHVCLAIVVAWLLARDVLAPWYGRPTGLRPYALLTAFMVLGGLAGGTLVGIYLVVSDRFFDLHHNEAFVVQSLIDYRNFLRMIIEPDGTLVVYPIGLRRVPRRWRKRMDRTETDPLYEPADDVLLPHLIEGPIRISHTAPSVDTIRPTRAPERGRAEAQPK